MSLDLEISDRAQRDIRAIVLYIAKRNRDLLIAERFGRSFWIAATKSPRRLKWAVPIASETM